MILTCPSCSASYLVPADAIGIDGRTVRCKKCSHTWFQTGEKKALEDLINRIQSTDIEVDELVFGNAPKKKKVPKERTGLLWRMIRRIRNIVLNSMGQPIFMRNVAAFMCALAIFSVVIYGLLAQRGNITGAFPSLNSIYTAIGFPVSAFANANPEDALIIEKTILTEHGKKREIVGNLINLTAETVKIPNLKAVFSDKHGTVLGEKIYVLPVQGLGKELSYGFHLEIPEKIPNAFTTISISFTE